ncbi:hypothetical protein CesoFtcFv8_026614 [Champsocephalus esox]|uniref:Uncharacterized protein n=1 Tax=Champsocephalus esox TaxID=159716 RepID=A0AAN8G453_9TELE|nr:hypothetical protein CesoFtcFv8_026614 [Champsocephalus esox]
MCVSLLLLLLVCGAQSTHFYGTVMTYYPKNTNADGSLTVVLRYKLSFHDCSSRDLWQCPSLNCGTQTSLVLNVVDQESSGEWCQREGIMTRRVPINSQFQLELTGIAWINNNNGIMFWRAVTGVELRNRSDIGQANTSPQTTILPALRVPSNCWRDFHLLDFDPDGDEVRCRYANSSLSECIDCTTPSVLSLSESCILSFSPTSSANEGPYIVQMVMEDFPRQTISLTQNGGLTVNSAISKIPVQFAVRVDPAVPSCTEGLYLPRFLTPTPANKAQLYAPVNQTLSISVNAEANVSTTLELLFSGPYNTNKSSLGAGRFLLRWTPSQEEDGESHPICFVVQSITSSTTKYQSELRCVIVTVGNEPTTTTTTTPTFNYHPYNNSLNYNYSSLNNYPTDFDQQYNYTSYNHYSINNNYPTQHNNYPYTNHTNIHHFFTNDTYTNNNPTKNSRTYNNNTSNYNHRPFTNSDCSPYYYNIESIRDFYI